MPNLILTSDVDAFLDCDTYALMRSALGLGTLATQSATIADYLTIAAAASLNTSGNAGTVTTISGRITAGTNVSITGSGTAADPYIINSSGGGGGGDALVSGTLDQFASVTMTGTLALTGAITINGGTHSGNNSGDQTSIVGITGTKAQFDTACTDGNFLYAGDVTSNATHTGDATGATALTLATVNANVGIFGSATQSVSLTINAKGLITAASATTITPAVGNVTGLGTGVATALAIALNAAGGPLTSGYMTPQALTSGASISFNAASGVQATLTLAHNATLGAPTNLADGQTASISGLQDGTGGRSLALNAAYLVMSGALADITALTAGKAFDLAIKRVGSVYRVWITTQP